MISSVVAIHNLSEFLEKETSYIFENLSSSLLSLYTLKPLEKSESYTEHSVDL